MSVKSLDLLLECLRHIALRYDRKLERESVLAALPVDRQKGVSPALFPRVAARVGFKATFAKTGFEALHEHTGPVIVLLEGNQVGLIFTAVSGLECYLLGADVCLYFGAGTG